MISCFLCIKIMVSNFTASYLWKTTYCHFYLSLFHQMLFSSQRPYQGEVRDTLRCLENIYQAFFEVPSIPRVDLSLSLKNIFFKNFIYIILILLNNNYYSMYIHSVHTFMINEIYLQLLFNVTVSTIFSVGILVGISPVSYQIDEFL